MSEWWTYHLSDFLLFSPRTYYRLFELYNLDIWPTQVAALVLGLAILVLLRQHEPWASRTIAAILAACWLFVAWAFHLERYATINWAAIWLAAAFALQALLLLWSGMLRGRLKFRIGPDMASRVGLCIFLFALALQPLLGLLLGRSWTQAEIFAVAPDPTAVATLGLLLLAARPARWSLMIIPLLWCAFSGATLWAMHSPDALVVPGIAILTLALAVWRKATAPDR